MMKKKTNTFPLHLRRPLPSGQQLIHTKMILQKYQLNTVCEEAKCPNRLECYTNKTATFLALGKECTRNCGFCEIGFSKTPLPPDPHEPDRIAHAALELNLSHIVITMVTRDDLSDQGAGHIAAIVRAVRKKNPKATIEVLSSDFNGQFQYIDQVIAEKIEIYNHNIETVRSLTPRIRHMAQYDRSLSILRHAKQSHSSIYVKSGIMLGLGERENEVKETLQDLANVGCDIVTIGQYLQPSQKKLPVKEFISIEQFQRLKQFGESLGIRYIYSNPFVRSDYNANDLLSLMKNLNQCTTAH